MGWYILIHWHSVASKRIFLHYITNPLGLTHSAVCIRVTGGKIRHGVQCQETRRTPAQVQTRITVILTHTNTRNTLKCKLWGLLWCSIHTFTLKHFCSTHREAKFLKLFSAEGTSSFVTQTALAFHLKRGLPEPVKHVPLLLKDTREMCVRNIGAQSNSKKIKWRCRMKLSKPGCRSPEVSSYGPPGGSDGPSAAHRGSGPSHLQPN